jgi:hypothetical protein
MTEGVSIEAEVVGDEVDGRGGRGNEPVSKPINTTSENVTPYMCVPNEEIVSNKKSDSQLAESSGAMDIIMNLRQTGSNPKTLDHFGLIVIA